MTLVVPYPEGFTCPPPGEVVHEDKHGLGGPRRSVVPTLGLRVPRWPAAARLLETLSFPLVASSANPSGAPAPATLDAVDPGRARAPATSPSTAARGGVASTVVDLSRYEDDGPLAHPARRCLGCGGDRRSASRVAGTTCPARESGRTGRCIASGARRCVRRVAGAVRQLVGWYNHTLGAERPGLPAGRVRALRPPNEGTLP